MEREGLSTRRDLQSLLGAVRVLFLDFGGGFVGFMGVHPLLLFQLCNTKLVTFLSVCYTS